MRTHQHFQSIQGGFNVSQGRVIDPAHGGANVPRVEEHTSTHGGLNVNKRKLILH